MTDGARGRVAESAIEALQQLMGLIERQAVALEAGHTEVVEALTAEIRGALDGIGDSEELHEAVRHDPQLRGAVERLIGTARLQRQSLHSVRARIGLRRAALERCGVQWYGDRPPTMKVDASLNLTV